MGSLKLATLSLVLSCILFKPTSSQGDFDGVCLSGNLDLVMVLDASTSVTERNFQIALQFIERTLWDADIDSGNVRVGLIVYSSNTHIHFSLGRHDNRNDMIRHLRKVSYVSGTSNTADALLALRTKVFGTDEDRPDARNVAFVITDGISGITEARTAQEAARTKNDGIEVYAIGVGLTNPSELDSVASEPLRKYRYIVDEYRNLEDLRTVLFQTNCVEVEELPEGTGFNHGCGSNPMDLVLLVDTSLGPRYQREIRSFLFDLVEYADIESGNVRIAMVTFNIFPQIQFRLGELSSKGEIQRAIREAPSPSGQRNTADALNLVRQQILHSRYGNREGVPDVLLFITTGDSTQNIDSAATALRDDNVSIFAVGVDLPNTREIDRISSEPRDEHTFVLPSASDLDDMKDLVFAQICTYAGSQTQSYSLPSVEESENLDLVFLLHFSNELQNDEFQQITSFIKNTLQGTDIDSGAVRVAAALYRQDGVVMFNLNQYATKEDLLHGVSRISNRFRSPYASAAAGLNTVHTLMFQENLGDRANSPNAVILLTDASSNLDADESLQAAKALHDSGASVFSIGIGVQDEQELAAIASKSENSFALNDASELDDLRRRLQSRIVAFQGAGPGPEIETVTSSAPIIDPARTLEYSDKADIFLVFHASSNVKAKEFKRFLLTYFTKLLDNADINSGNVRVSLVAYKDTAQIVFDLSEHQTKAKLLKAIRKTSKKLRSNSARLASALQTIREVLLSPEKGNREDVPDAVVIVTDRKSGPRDNGTDEAELLKNAGTKIFAIGVGKADENELRAVVSEPTDEYFGKVPDYKALISKPEIKSIVVRRISALKEPRNRQTPPPPTPSQTRRPTEPWTEPTEIIPVTYRPLPREPPTTERVFINFVRTPESVTVRLGQVAVLICTAEGEPEPTVTWQKDGRSSFPASRERRLQVLDDGRFVITNVRTEDEGIYRCTANNKAGTIFSEATVTVIVPTTTTTTTTTPRPTPPPRPLHAYDLVLILDSSVPPSIFDWILDFARRFIQVLSIDNEEFRVGLLIYSTDSHPQFNLNDYSTKAEVLNAIDLVPYRPGQTNTARAFETVHNRMFTRRNGDRDYARNFIVLVTGNEESLNTGRTQAAVDTVKRARTSVFVIGLDIRDTREVDDIASDPTRSYQFLIRGRNDLMEVPDPLVNRIRRLPQPPIPERRTTPRPTTTTTTTTPRPKVTQRPRPPGKCTSTGDIVFILDSSGSVGDEYFWKVLNFTYSTVDGLDIDSGHFRIGVITFSGSSRNEFFLNTFSTKADIEAALQKIQYVYGFTHTSAALRAARLEQFSPSGGDRRDVPNVLVIITDGQSNIQHYQTIPEALRLKRLGVTIITIAVGFTGQTAELVGLTSPPIEENLIYVDNYEALDQLTTKLVTPLCTDSNLCAESNPCHNGGSCVDGLRSYMCQCPNRFFGDHCEKRCGDSADVVFVLDSSTSVGSESFNRMKTYTEHLVREMNMEACNIHVGAMKYSSAAMVQFGLGTYQDTESTTRAVDGIHYTKGQANMGDAIRTLRTSMFNGRNGDRRGVKNIAYLLTDGSNQVHPEATLSEAELAINSGIRIIPIGVSFREREEVESIALSQGVNTIEIADEPQLLMMSDHVLAPLFDREDRCLENPCQHGGSCVNEILRFQCHCVAGYSGDTCERRCTSKGDVVFAVDTSRYMTRKELRQVRRFIRSIVKRMQFHSTSFKVGLVDFSRSSIVHLDFSSGDNKKSVLAAMATLRSRAGDPSPAEALMKARIRVFGGHGEKKERPDYLILVSKSMRGQQDIFKEANKLKTEGVKIIGVGIGMTNSDKDYMTAAVSTPLRSSLYLADSVSDLKKISDQIMENLCDAQDKCAENPCQNGGTCMSNHGDYYCQCTASYAGPHCEQGCDAVADVVFLLDSSGSVGHHNFRKVKDFVYNMVDHMSIGKDATRVSVATFSTRTSLPFYLNEYYSKDALQNAISGVSYEYGNTNTAAGLKLVRHRILSRNHGDRPEAQNFLVVITDGLSNINPENTVLEANLIKKHGTHIYAVGVGAFDPWELNSIASEPASSNAYMINDYSALGDISDNLIRATCRDSSICLENPCRNGGTCIPGINTFTCECAHGYKGKFCDRECMSKKDIVFVLDSSGSVGETNFNSALNFLAALVEELSGEGVDNEFGFVTYSTDVQLVFSLGRYRDIETVINALLTSRYRPGATNTAGGLRTAIELFGPGYGNRADAENLVILLTDGESNVDAHDTIPAARDLKGIARILTVAVGLTNTDEIEQIASSDKDIYKVTSYSSLGNVKADILGSSCSSQNDDS